MMELAFFSSEGESQGVKAFEIPSFANEKGLYALKQVVLAHAANRRQGSVSTKTRRTVHGTGKKPFRQKGTGIARQGSKVGPQHYHGSVAHGPQPRDFSQRINKKMKRLALARALFDRALDTELKVIAEWAMPEVKTAAFDRLLNKLAVQGTVLVLDDSWQNNSLLSARNISRLELQEASDVSAYELCQFGTIICSERGLECLLKRIKGEQK
jgi:large subunit ribosomal protein L4